MCHGDTSLSLLLDLAFHVGQIGDDAASARLTLAGVAAGTGYTRYRGRQRVFLEIQPLEALELAQAQGQPADFVAVEIQVLELLELAEILGYLGQEILAQIQLDYLRQGREGFLNERADE